jgi:hypothetical protein
MSPYRTGWRASLQQLQNIQQFTDYFILCVDRGGEHCVSRDRFLLEPYHRYALFTIAWLLVALSNRNNAIWRYCTLFHGRWRRAWTWPVVVSLAAVVLR